MAGRPRARLSEEYAVMTYEFDAAPWLWAARQADTWTFVSLPTDIADEILDLAGGVSRGLGSLRVDVTIGDTDWRPSIFPSTSGTYVLPVKKAVRTAEGSTTGDTVPVRS